LVDGNSDIKCTSAEELMATLNMTREARMEGRLFGAMSHQSGLPVRSLASPVSRAPKDKKWNRGWPGWTGLGCSNGWRGRRSRQLTRSCRQGHHWMNQPDNKTLRNP
jgi:hypothetical protein